MRFPRSEFERRLRRVRNRMDEGGFDLLLAFSSPGSMRYGQRGHVMYLSGYEPYFGDSMFALPADKDRDALLLVDSADYFPSDCTWVDRVEHASDTLEILCEYLRDERISSPRIALVGEYSLSPRLLRRLRDGLERSSLRYASELLEAERSVKSEYELKCIRRACNIAKKGFERAGEFARAGVKESQIVSEVERVCREEGSEGFPHHTMVSSGKDEKHLEWWWYCARRRLRQGDSWNLDLGTMYGGYCCDIARSFAVGKASDRLVEIYEVLVDAEKAGQKAARPGVPASEVNEAVIEVMSESFAGDFTGIGHGVGLEVHEWPFVGYQYIRGDPVYEDRVLEEDMVISIEPQVYDRQVGYVQIEDEFRVTPSGGKILNAIPREIHGCRS